jgi:hypothetical protein
MLTGKERKEDTLFYSLKSFTAGLNNVELIKINHKILFVSVYIQKMLVQS